MTFLLCSIIFDKTDMIKPVACYTCDYCPTIKPHNFIYSQCYKLTREKTSKILRAKSPQLQCSIKENPPLDVSSQEDFEICPGPYRFHRSDFTTPKKKESRDTGCSLFFWEKLYYILLCKCFWPSVFLCAHSLPPAKPNKTKIKPFWTQQTVVNHIWQSISLKDHKILPVWWQ